MLFVDVTRSVAFIEPWKIVSASLAAFSRWWRPRSFVVPAMSVEWLAEFERRSAKQGGQY